jgi:hypothetical protein
MKIVYALFYSICLSLVENEILRSPLALDTARSVIKLEKIDASNNLEKIASAKNKYVSHTISIVVYGTVGLAFLIFAIMNPPFFLPNIIHSNTFIKSIDFISFIIWIIAGVSWISCIEKAISHWLKERRNVVRQAIVKEFAIRKIKDGPD